MEVKGVTNTNIGHIQTSLTPGVHPTAKSSSTVWIPPRSQVIKISQKAPPCASCSWCALHRGVKIEIFVSLWLHFKGQSGEILLGVNTSIMKKNIRKTFFWFAKPKILTPRCHAHCSRIFEICDWISLRNQNYIRTYFSLFIRGPDRFKSWQNGGRKSRDTLPLK